MTTQKSALFNAYQSNLNRRLHPWQLVMMAAFMAIGIAAILSLSFIRSSQFDIEVGDPSPQRIESPQTRTFTSEYLTSLERDRAAAAVGDVYTPIDRSIGRVQVDTANELFTFIDVVRADSIATQEEKIRYLEAVESAEIDTDIAQLLLDTSGQSLTTIRSEAERIVNQQMRLVIRDDDLGNVIENRVSSSMGFVSESQETILMALVPDLIVPNSFYNEPLTEQARTEAREVIEPISQSVKKDQIILDEGDLATAEKIEILEQLGILQQETNWWEFGSILLVSALSTALIFLYYLRYRESHYQRLRYMLLLLLLVLAFAASAEFLFSQQSILSYIFPAAALSMLLAVIFDGRFASLITFVMAGIVGFVSNGSLEMTFYAFVGSLIAIYTLRDTQRINAYFRAGVLAIIGNLTVIGIFNLTTLPDPIDLLQIAGLAIASGGFAAMLTIAGFYIIGSFFGITTMLQLQELSRFDQPLLQELLHKAPGTYHHSIMVANLAEQAADRINANSLLVRVGAFYHDIGKMEHAPFFSENQEGINPHDTLAPRESAVYIVGHVKEGLAMARKNRLPERIQDFIAEHHGNNVLNYFYKKACDIAAENEELIELVDKVDFSYPGPRPSSRETGIVMMADAVEATSKAVQPNNVAAIEKLVRTIVDELIAANQLDNSGLTMGEIRDVRASFVETLQGRYHSRVKYAGNEELEAANTPTLEAETSPAPLEADEKLALPGSLSAETATAP